MRISNKVNSIFRIFSYLSFDVAFGAVAVGLYFCHIFSIAPPPYWGLILFLATLTVYNLDHLIDSSQDVDFSGNSRRLFHKNHKTPILFFVFITSALSGLLGILYFPWNYWVLGLVLFGLCLLYFMLISNFVFIPKEFIIAFFYTAGILFVPLFKIYEVELNGKSLIDSVVFHSILVYLLAFQNLITNSWIDREDDIRENFSSLPILWGSKAGSRLIYAVGFLVILLTVFAFVKWNSIFGYSLFIFCLIASIPIIALLSEFNGIRKFFRILGEWSFSLFYIPLLINYL